MREWLATLAQGPRLLWLVFQWQWRPPQEASCAHKNAAVSKITCGQHNVDTIATDVKRILFLPVWGSSARVFSGSSALAQELLSPTGARAKVLGEWVLVRWGAGWDRNILSSQANRMVTLTGTCAGWWRSMTRAEDGDVYSYSPTRIAWRRIGWRRMWGWDEVGWDGNIPLHAQSVWHMVTFSDTCTGWWVPSDSHRVREDRVWGAAAGW